MALNFKVSPEKAKALMDKLESLSIKEADVQEKFVRSGGPGGQNVNKVSTCVYLKHLPTGIEVKMARERSQGLNRFLAWRQLADRIEAEAEGRNSREQQLIEKIRRQKRKRSKRAQEKVLQAKHLQSEKKAARKLVGDENGLKE